MMALAGKPNPLGGLICDRIPTQTTRIPICGRSRPHDDDLARELSELLLDGKRLTRCTNFERRFVSTNAAGWHNCFDVLDHVLCGTPFGSIAGAESVN